MTVISIVTTLITVGELAIKAAEVRLRVWLATIRF
jgi:hypothetical protein